MHSDYRPEVAVVPLGVAQPPAAPLQERALLVHRHQRRHRRPAVRHLPRPGDGRRPRPRCRTLHALDAAELRTIAPVTVHHLNCATMRPRGSLGGRLAPAHVVAHCLLVERPDGLLLVDTGFGTADVADPRRLGRPFSPRRGPALDPAETAPRPGRGARPPASRTSPTSRSPTSTSTTPAGSATSRAPGSTSSATSWTPRCTRRCARGPATSAPSGRTARTGCATRSPATTGSASTR